MPKTFDELRGEGIIEEPKKCMWCQMPLLELDEDGFCSLECADKYNRSFDEWFKFTVE